MLDLVYYLHWFLMILVGVAGVSLIFRPHPLARIYMIGFIAQQLILNGCIMTLWENSIKVSMGVEPRTNEFIMAHIFNPEMVIVFKIMFLVILVVQIYELIPKKRGKLKWA